MRQSYGAQLVLSRFRISVSDRDPKQLQPLVEGSSRETFRGIYPPTRDLLTEIQSKEKELSKLRAAFPKTPVMQELPPQKARQTRIHVRGNFLNQGEVVQPALHKGHVVLCDRFISATCAYQGAAGYDIQRVLDVAPFAIGETWPDLTIVLDIDIDAGFARTGRKTHQAGRNRKRNAGQHSMFDDALTDAMEARSTEFHRKVRDIFRQLPQLYPQPVRIVDATADIGAVHQQVVQILRELFV